MAVINLTNNNFEDEVMKSSVPVLIDFWAGWCGPCKMVAPVIEEIASEVKNAKVGKVNVEEQGELAAAFGIMSIPTLIVVKNGKVQSTAIGARKKAEILKMLENA